MGMANVARTAPARAALRALHGSRSAAGGAHHSTDCQRTDEESGMTSTLTLSLRARNANRAKNPLPDLPDPSVRSARREGRRARDLYPGLHHLSSGRYRSSLHRRGFDGRSQARGNSQAHLSRPQLRLPSDPALFGPAGARSRPQHPHIPDRSVFRGAASPFRPDRAADPRAAVLDRSAAGGIFLAAGGPPAALRSDAAWRRRAEDCRWIRCFGNIPSSITPANGLPSR